MQVCVVDEAHRLKNAESRLCRLLREDFGYRAALLLTGTPLQNNTVRALPCPSLPRCAVPCIRLRASFSTLPFHHHHPIQSTPTSPTTGGALGCLFNLLYPPTPTPPQEELWTLLNFAAPSTFPDRAGFEAAYGDIKDQAQLQRLQAAIRPFLLRRMKEDVEKNLPPKEETIIDGGWVDGGWVDGGLWGVCAG